MHTPHPAWLQEILVPVKPKLALRNLAKLKVDGISPFLTTIKNQLTSILLNFKFKLTGHFLFIDIEMNVSFFNFEFTRIL